MCYINEILCNYHSQTGCTKNPMHMLLVKKFYPLCGYGKFQVVVGVANPRTDTGGTYPSYATEWKISTKNYFKPTISIYLNLWWEILILYQYEWLVILT